MFFEWERNEEAIHHDVLFQMAAGQQGALLRRNVKNNIAAKLIADAVLRGLGVNSAGSHSRFRTSGADWSLRLDRWRILVHQNQFEA
jgi:hypothetical protein